MGKKKNANSELIKSEINSLKLSIIQKDESIKSIKEKSKSLEIENKLIRVQMNENIDKLNIELVKKKKAMILISLETRMMTKK